MIDKIISIIAEGEYEHYGLRAHRGVTPRVGQSLGTSRVWIDGDCTDEELDGICSIKVKSAAEIPAIIERLRREYSWNGEELVLVGGHRGSWGEDPGEIVIRDNICLAVL